MFSPPPLTFPAPSTPTSYITYNFPLPQPPSKHYVGILACQRDPLLMTLDTEVIKCEKREAKTRIAEDSEGKAKKGKGTKGTEKKVEGQGEVNISEDEWEIELLDTVLFPEGGGQPSDTGTLTPLSDSPTSKETSIKVHQVLRRNLDAIHYTKEPIEVGTRVRVNVDRDGRIDKMCQHTGQHLLSGLLDTLSLPTLSWSLTPSPQPCYIELPRAPTPSELAFVQQKCNEIIQSGARVKVEVKRGEEVPDSVPEDYKGIDGEQGVVRTVEIIGLDDKNPCCGTHFPSLSSLSSLFILPQTTPIRSPHVRLHFLVGPRVLLYLSQTHSIVRSATMELKCNMGDLVERVKGINEERLEGVKKEKRLREEVAKYVAGEIWRESIEEGRRKKGFLWREEDITNSLEFLNSVSYALKAILDELPSPPPAEYLFILTTTSSPPSPSSSSSTPSSSSSSSSILIIGTESLVLKAGKLVGVALGGRVKGGGKGRWQGKVGGRFEEGDEGRLRGVLEECLLS